MHVINHDDIDDNNYGDDVDANDDADDDCENVHINCCNVIFGPIVSGFSSVQFALKRIGMGVGWVLQCAG